MNTKNRGLGKGLESIFLENNISGKSKYSELGIDEISPNEFQVRKKFDQISLQNLSKSIISHGILQPIIVAPCEGFGYKIVAGERRYRASKMAGLSKVPVIIVDSDSKKNASVALIENLQRESLNAIEEAKGYQDLKIKFNYTQEKISKEVGKSRSLVTNALRLLTLPDEVIKLVKNDAISPAHARTLLSLKDKTKILKISKKIISKNLSVRDLEKICKKENNETKTFVKQKSNFFCDIENLLKINLARKVKIKNLKEEKGFIQIEFKDKDDLKRIAELFKNKINV